jgi:hypothetical protein
MKSANRTKGSQPPLSIAVNDGLTFLMLSRLVKRIRRVIFVPTGTGFGKITRPS